MDPAGHTGRGGRFHPGLGGEDGNRRHEDGRLDRTVSEQVPRLDPEVWEGQRAQRPDSTGLVAGLLGGRRDRPVLPRPSWRGISTGDVHDDRRGRGSGESEHGVPGAEGEGGTAVVESHGVEEGNRI